MLRTVPDISQCLLVPDPSEIPHIIWRADRDVESKKPAVVLTDSPPPALEMDAYADLAPEPGPVRPGSRSGICQHNFRTDR